MKHICAWKVSGTILTDKNQSNKIKNVSSSSVSTTDSTQTGKGLNAGSRNKIPATNLLAFYPLFSDSANR
jgi:hypothetical protein